MLVYRAALVCLNADAIGLCLCQSQIGFEKNFHDYQYQETTHENDVKNSKYKYYKTNDEIRIV